MYWVANSISRLRCVPRRWKASAPGDLLDRYIRDERIGSQLEDFSLSFNCISKPSWQILILMLGVINITWAAVSFLNIRYTSLAVQSIRLDSSTQVQSMRLFYKDQEQTSLSNESGDFNLNASICFDRLSALVNSSTENPFKFSVSGDGWKTGVSLSSSGRGWAHHQVSRTQQEIHLAINPPWQQVADTVVCDWFLGITLIATAVCSSTHRTRFVIIIIRLYASMSSAIRFLCAATYMLDGHARESIPPFLGSILGLVTSAAIERFASSFIPASILLSALWAAGNAANRCLLLRDCAALLTSPPITALSIGALSTASLLRHGRRRQWAAAAAAADGARYEAAWERLRHEEGDALALLAAVDSDLAVPAAALRQMCRTPARFCPNPVRSPSLLGISEHLLSADSEGLGSAASGRAKEHGADRPMTSLDQLYAQVLQSCFAPSLPPAYSNTPDTAQNRCPSRQGHDQTYRLSSHVRVIPSLPSLSLAPQALAVAPLLWAAAARWAESTGGAVARRPPRHASCLFASAPWVAADAGEPGAGARDGGGGGGGLRPPAAESAGGLEGGELATIKAADRAAEKTRACYGGDPSRLLDVCRARIVYSSAAGLLGGAVAVLGAGAATGPGASVRVVRVRNGFGPVGDGVFALGFRVGPAPLTRTRVRRCRSQVAAASDRCLFPIGCSDVRGT
jgi:hypothetical protein